MIKVLRGIVHGRTMEFESDPGVADGEVVEVIVSSPEPIRTGEGILRTAGILADDSEWDRIMADIQAQRKLDRRPQLDEWDAE